LLTDRGPHASLHKRTAPRVWDAAAVTSHRVTKRAPLSVGRVKPVTTRLPRLVARGCPAAVLGHLVRYTCLRLVRPVDKPPNRKSDRTPRSINGKRPRRLRLRWSSKVLTCDIRS
jgi:hypothetical protein